MRKTHWTAALVFAAAMALAVPPLFSQRPVDAALQKKIDKSVQRGVAYLKSLQKGDGTWPRDEIGATALAGLTLLECGVDAEHAAIQKAADAVRKSAVSMSDTYSVSLAILFLDRLRDARDLPFIEALGVRLVAGQNNQGMWSYGCSRPSPAEILQLTSYLNKFPTKKDPADKDKKKKRDLSKLSLALQEHLQRNLGRPFAGGDNSNTQFAALALWVARRHGIPADQALLNVEKYYRDSQQAAGGWSYEPLPLPGSTKTFIGPATATMTCAGLIGLAVGRGIATEKGKKVDLKKDKVLQAGLEAVGSVLTGRAPAGSQGARPMRVDGGKIYYFLWTMERMAVLYDVKVLGGVDWYRWGAEQVLSSQGADGSWRGEFQPGGSDTCFALLFLKRANVAQDLTFFLTGIVDETGGRQNEKAKKPPKKADMDPLLDLPLLVPKKKDKKPPPK